MIAHADDRVELPAIRPETTRIKLHRGDCPCCGKAVTAKAPADMPPGSAFGPGIVALVTYLHGCQMVSYVRLAEMLEGLFGLKSPKAPSPTCSPALLSRLLSVLKQSTTRCATAR